MAGLSTAFPGSIRAASQQDLPLVRKLFLEYAASLGIDLGFQRFDEELATLPGRYAEPEGIILLAFQGPAPAGVVALRPLAEKRCEMKRLFVSRQARGAGFGSRLVQAVIAHARNQGYRQMLLDTLPSMRSALALYQANGFERIDPYYENPNDAFYYRLLL